jgi:hypothetical protein
MELIFFSVPPAVFSVSAVVNAYFSKIHHRDTEVTEGAQRVSSKYDLNIKLTGNCMALAAEALLNAQSGRRENKVNVRTMRVE